MKYRTEIDGLRALAVVPVILFHAGFELFSGGFVGVDVFFVISGYLITTILIEDIENKRFSIVNFYERRARRILPALFFVILVCIPFAWVFMLPSQMRDFSQSLAAVSLFASNILFWRESGYFAAAAEEKPLLHTWSLAVEEQYYVLFPIFLILAWRFGKNRVFWMIVVMAVISLMFSEWGWRYAASANFYLAPARAWELFAGSVAAFIVQRRGVRKNNTLALIGLASIIFSIFAYDESTPFPSVYALVPVLGVVLLVLYANKETLVAKLLGTKALVGVGLISYSAYLWHQPLFAFARIILIEHPSVLFMMSLSFASIVLAYFSWKYVEKPFRNLEAISRRNLFSVSSLFAALFLSLGLSGHLFSKNIETYWLSKQTESFRSVYEIIDKAKTTTSNWGATNDKTQDISKCVFNVRELNQAIEDRILECYSQYGSGALILGDSHAIDLFGVVASSQNSPFIIGVTKAGCRPHNNFDYCHYDRVKDFIAENQRIFEVIVYEQAGFYLLQQSDGTKGSRSMFSRLPIGASVDNITVDLERVSLTADYLSHLSQFATIKWFLPRAEPHIRKEFVLRYGCEFKFQYRPNQYEIFQNLDIFIQDYVAENYADMITTVSQNESFNFNFPSDYMTCDAIFWSDGDHLSTSGEQRFGARLPENFLAP